MKRFTNFFHPNLFSAILFTVLILTSISSAAIKTSAGTGQWGTNATWSPSGVPAATDSVIIASGHTVTISTSSRTCGGLNIVGSLSITAGLTLTVTGGGSSPVTFGSVGGAGTLNGTGADANTFVIMNGNYTFTGSIPNANRMSLSFIGSNDQTIISTASVGVRNYTVNKTGGTLFIQNTPTTTNAAVTISGNVSFNRDGAQTVTPATYPSGSILTLAGSGAKTTTSVTVNGILSIEGTATASAAPTYGASATLRYNTATARTVGAEWLATFAATGGVIIANTGVITLNAAKVFNASVPLTINSGAALNTSASNFQLTIGGNFSNAGTFTANASPIVIANTMATQSISGFTTTGTVSMTKTAGTATFTGNVNGNGLTLNGSGGTLNLGSGLIHTFTGNLTSTAGTLNGGSSILRIAGSVSGTAGIFVAGTGTFDYNGASQTIAPVTYNNLTFSGTGGKTFPTGTTTVNGIFSVENGNNANTFTGTLSYGANATLRYNATRTASTEWITPFVATGGVVIAGGNVTLNGAKQIGNNTNIVLTINNGATLTTANNALTFHGNFVNNGTFTAGSSAITIGGTVASQSIPGFTTTGTVSMTKTSGTATFTGNVNGGGLTINGSGGTLNLGEGFTHTFSGNWTRTAGTLQGNTSTLRIAGNVAGTGGSTFTPNTSTVNWNGAAQTIAAVTYHHLILSGSGIKTTSTGTTTVNGDLTVSDGITFRNAGHTMTINGTTMVGGGTSGVLEISNASNTKTFAGAVSIAENGTWNNTGNSPVSFRGGISNSGTFTAGTGVHTFETNPQGLSGIITIPSITVTGVTLTNNGTLTVTTALEGTGTLTNAASRTLKLNLPGAAGINTLTADANGNVVSYGFAGAQTVKPATYHHLTLEASGAKTMTDVTVINGDLTAQGSSTISSNSSFTVSGTFNYFSTGSTVLSASIPVSVAKYNQTDGTLNTNGSTFNVTGSGADVWTKTGGTFIGTATFTGSDPQASGEMEDVTVTNNMTLSGDLTVNGTLELNAGNISIGANTLTLSGPVEFNDGKLRGSIDGNNLGTSNLILDGAGAITGNLNVSASNYLNNFSTNRNVTLEKGLYVTGDITLDDATLTLNTNSLHFYGDLNVTGGGTIDATGSGFYVYGTGDLTLPAITADQFSARRDGNIILNGAMTAQTFSLDMGTIIDASNLTVNGSLWRNAGSLDEAPASVNNLYYRASPDNLLTSFELLSDASKVRIQVPGNLILDKNLTAIDLITLNTGFLDVNGFDIAINPGGMIDEQSGYLRGTSGSATITDDLTYFPNKSNPGGLGLMLYRRSSGMSWGNTSIVRGFVAQEVSPGEFGINRYYVITPSNVANTKIDFLFNYLAEDLNGNDPNDLQLYMSTDDGTTWTLIPEQTPSYPNNVISKTGFTFTSASIMITAKGTQIGDGAIVADDQTRQDENDKTRTDDKRKDNDRTKGDDKTRGDDQRKTDEEAKSRGDEDQRKTNEDVKSREVENNSEIEIIREIPSEFGLVQNYPNPFNPTTTIKFGLPESDFVSVKVFDITGREIAELASGQMNAGYHTVQFDGTNLSSGIYFYKITTGSGFNQIMKMSLIK